MPNCRHCRCRARYDPAVGCPRAGGRLFASAEDRGAVGASQIRLFGREVLTPRLELLDRRSRSRLPLFRTPRLRRNPGRTALLAIKNRLEAAAGVPFNSVLANRYRDGRDAMGWHSDDEPRTGRATGHRFGQPGRRARFVLKRRRPAAPSSAGLPHGSLLLMQGDTQANYRHACRARPSRCRRAHQPDVPQDRVGALPAAPAKRLFDFAAPVGQCPGGNVGNGGVQAAFERQHHIGDFLAV